MLFREAVGKVRRLPAVDPPPRPPGPGPTVRQHLADEARALQEMRSPSQAALARALGEPLAFRREHLPAPVLERLRRGEIAVQDEIDLHRLRADAAEAALRHFLGRARRLQFPCVRLIHGKGLHSEHGPVLKALVDRLLRQRGEVLAYCSAPAAQGGDGATLVLLDNT